MPRSCTYASENTAEIGVSQVMGYLKGKSSLIIFEGMRIEIQNGSRHFLV